MKTRTLVLLFVVVGCGHRSELKGSPLGYASPALIAQWVGACSAPIAQHPNLLGIDVSCDERQGEDPAWRIAVLYKDGAILTLTMSERTQSALARSVEHRLDKLVGRQVAAALGDQLPGGERETIESGVEVTRANFAGDPVNPPIASIRWILPTTTSK